MVAGWNPLKTKDPLHGSSLMSKEFTNDNGITNIHGSMIKLVKDKGLSIEVKED